VWCRYRAWGIGLVIVMCTSAGIGSLHPGFGTCSIPLKGTACGGRLLLVEHLSKNARYVEVGTEVGETAETVVRHLAEAINATKCPLGWMGKPPYVAADGPILTDFLGFKGWYCLAGTETGVGIPRAALPLSCSYDPETDLVELQWENPKSGYDALRIFVRSSDGANISKSLDGNSTHMIIFRKERPVDVNSLDVRLVGYIEKVPSNVTGLHVEGFSQDERFGIPFTDNVAPNWRGWLMSSDKNAVEFGQGVRERFLFTEGDNGITHPATKPFYQIIRTRSADAQGGIWRKFLGLRGGHSYRVAARISTLEMDSAERDWSFSLHGAYNARGGADLTVAQLAGLAALPNGKRGTEAGRIALYHPVLTTQRSWEERSTGKQWRDEFVPDITVPEGVDTITVWVRCRSAGEGAFGIDWVKLEDITLSGAKTDK